MNRVRVKPLVWEDCRENPGVLFTATTPVGRYEVDLSEMPREAWAGLRWCAGEPVLWGSSPLRDADAAKAAALADYETRILAALEPQDAPAVAEELVALRAENARLRKALTFYANPEIYRPHPNGPAFDRRDVSYVATAARGGLLAGVWAGFDVPELEQALRPRCLAAQPLGLGPDLPPDPPQHRHGGVAWPTSIVSA